MINANQQALYKWVLGVCEIQSGMPYRDELSTDESMMNIL